MKLLVIDGNSLLNRAFYAIKLLSNKSGQFTNAVFGFMNMYLNLKQQCEPDGTVVAFDLKAPTFRHKMYSEYKAGRKPMPPELAQQLPIIKELLQYLGCVVVEKEGWEADDILGTLASGAKDGDTCFIATGDRDSLQLVSDKTTVLLATTKLGSVVYDEEKIMEEYGVTPPQMIEIKALQGDSSDNIPGIEGIGPKTAIDFIKTYGSIDCLYDLLPEIKVTPKMRERLENGKESAYMSRILGTISTEVPIDKNYESYKYKEVDKISASKLLSSLEMFKILEKLDLQLVTRETEQKESKVVELDCVEMSADEAIKFLEDKEDVYLYCEFENDNIACVNFSIEEKIVTVSSMDFFFEKFIEYVLSSKSIKKTVYDSKKLYAYAFERGYDCENIVMDVLLGGYVLNPSSNDYSVIRLANEYGISIPRSNCDENCIKAYLLQPVRRFIEKKIAEYGAEKLFYDVEMPLAEVLASMECYGFKVDKDGIYDYGVELEKKITQLKDSIYEQVGYEFNINSPKQLGEALFEKLGLPAKKKTKSGYSTNAEVLESLVYAHPVIPMILEYRTFTKLKSTYCDGLLKVVCSDGRIHSTFNQTETRTGRLSSTEPNLQNIPVRTPEGRELRKFFIADEGKILVDADYSQIELRVLAHMSDDKAMIDAFNNELDIHTETASQVFNMPENMVTPLMRSRAKAVNFGIVYGIGAFSLAKDIGVTRKEADNYIKGYLEHYSGVKNFMDKSVDEAKESGFAHTLFNRRRYLPELSSSNAMLRAFGERVAMNMPVQGTAADIIKIAMVKVYNRLKEENLKSRLIMQVHDELIVEAPENEAQRAKEIVCEEMQNACEMSVKLVSDASIGKTWYLAKG